jgi:hypothetical protein
MATAHPLPAQVKTQGREPEATLAAEAAAEQALVPSPRPVEAKEPIVLSAPVARLPVELDVAIPVREFRVQLAWSEFEVIDTQLAVRVTRLA